MHDMCDNAWRTQHLVLLHCNCLLLVLRHKKHKSWYTSCMVLKYFPLSVTLLQIKASRPSQKDKRPLTITALEAVCAYKSKRERDTSVGKGSNSQPCLQSDGRY